MKTILLKQQDQIIGEVKSLPELILKYHFLPPQAVSIWRGRITRAENLRKRTYTFEIQETSI